MKYHRGLMIAVLHGRISIPKAVNTTVIPLDQAPQGYADFDRGAAKKFVIDPNGLLGARS
jgi:glutathione-independent formaldehyde dehydrogenase